RIWSSPAWLVELLHCKLEFILGGGHSVEFRIVLHERDAFAFYRVGHDAGGPALSGFGFPQRGLDGREIVTVDLDGVPAEGPPFIGQRRDLHNVLHEAVELDAVVVHNGHHIIHLMVWAGHGRFPNLAFLDLAIAEHHVGARWSAIQPRA